MPLDPPDWRGRPPEQPWPAGAPLRVFIGHTAELRTFPADRAFVAAAQAGVVRARHVPVEMGTFGALDAPAARYCVEQVQSCHVYVGLVGFRYGSPTRERPELSFSELEFEAATAAGMPRLVFLLADDALVPVQSFTDSEYHDRQARFRDRLARDNGLVVATFRGHADLELLVYEALSNLRRGAAGGIGTTTRVPVGPGPLTTSPGDPPAPAPASRLWMVPAPTVAVVPRPELTDLTVARVLSSAATGPRPARAGAAAARPDGAAGGTGSFRALAATPGVDAPARVVLLHGTGGIGKTTLAAEVCRRPRIAAGFPGGVLWVTLGEAVEGATLADKINDLCEALSGTRPALADPEQAGFRLGQLLGTTERLLVIDDVWRRFQLAPFLQGGPGCLRLVTSRRRDLVTGAVAADVIDVPAMADSEAVRLLTQDLESLLPPSPRAGPGAADPGALVLPAEQVRRLLDATGRWPVLLRLVNRALARMVRDGVPPSRAAARVLRRLDRRGPTALDVSRPDEDRHEAVGATLAASVGLLTGDQHERYQELAIFPEDVWIPRYVLEAYWGATGGLDPDEVDDLCQELADLSLVLAYRSHPPALLLQDVLRAYLLRAEVSPQRLRALHGGLCDALRGRLLAPGVPRQATGVDDPSEPPADSVVPVPPLPDGEITLPDADARPAQLASPAGPAPWWELPDWASYVWTHLVSHLAGAGRADEALALVRDLRWTAAKLAQPSLGLVAVDADLALTGALAPTDPVPRALRRVLRQTAHLFGPTDPPEALPSVLASRLDGIPALASARARFAAAINGPRLVNRWSLPDQPPPGLVRVLPGHQRSINSCVIAPGGDWIASAADDGTVQIWAPDATTPRVVLHGHRGAVHACAVFPDGRLLVSVGEDGITRIWDSDGGPARYVLAGHTGEVLDVAVAPSGRWFATSGADGTVRCWYTSSGEAGPVLEVTAGRAVRAVAIGPDALLAAGCEDGRIRLFDLNHGADLVGDLTGHRGPVRALATGTGSAWLVSVGQDGTARRWDPAALAPVSRYEVGASGAALDCAVSADGSLVAATAGDGVVRLWETTTGARRQLVGPTGTAAVCALSADGSWLVSAGRHGVLRVWDTHGTDPEPAAPGRDEGMRACVVSHDGRWIVSVAEDGTAARWDVETGELGVQQMGEGLTYARGGARAPDSTWFAVPASGGGVRLWEPEAGAGTETDQIRAVLTSPSPVASWAAAPDGSWLVGACEDGLIRKWDTQSGEWLESFRAWPPPRTDGQILDHSGGEDLDRFSRLGPVAAHGGRQACAVAPDGSWVAAGGADIRVWDAVTLEQIAVLAELPGEVLGLAVAPDGSFLVAACADHVLRVYHTDGWRPGPVLAGHAHTVRAADVSPDGAYLASAAGDGAARVWDTATWRCVALTRFDGAARDCSWLPDSRGLAVAASHGLYLYDLLLD